MNWIASLRGWWLLLLFLSMGGLCISAQTQDTLALQEVIVVEKAGFSGEYSDVVDQEVKDQQASAHLGDLLIGTTGVFVKSYGSGSSATTSIRGGSAEHTRVLWNDLPLENPMLGQLDFSLLPSLFVDEAEVHYGSNTAAWGNGAIGGTIELNTTTDWDKRNWQAQYTATAGAFGLQQQGIQLGYTHKKFQIINRSFYRKADNNFSYLIRPDLPYRQQTNSKTKQWGSLQEFHYRINNRHQINAYFWYQNNDRQLPPNATKTRSVAYQLDDTKRLTAAYQYTGNQFLLKAQLAGYDENMQYVDSLIGYDDGSRFRTLIGQVKGIKSIGKYHRWTMGLQQIHYQANTDLYEESAQQHRFAIWSGWQTTMEKFQFDLSVRQEWQDGDRLPLVPSAGTVYRPLSWWSVRGRVSRNYRSPNLNALYYHPTGNPDLLPESGWSAEAGMGFDLIKKTNWQAHFEGTVFRRNIKNWIRWILPSAGFFYTPMNIAEVETKGIEQRLKIARQTDRSVISLEMGYDYWKAIHKKSIATPRINAGSQLVYTPKHQFFSILKMRYKKAIFLYQHRLTGSVTTLNNTTLPRYHLGNFSLGYTINTGQWNHQINLRIPNFWNTQYRILDRQGMPGRHWEIQVRSILKNK